jgi:AraC-like DNA-binding protein
MMRKATAELAAGRKVKDVAAELGYSRPEAFSKAFNLYSGAWPSSWRHSSRGA